GRLPAAVPAVLLDLRGRLRGARLPRRDAGRRHLRHPRADLHGLLLRAFPDHSAAAWLPGEAEAAAGVDFGGRACEIRRLGPAGRSGFRTAVQVRNGRDRESERMNTMINIARVAAV